MLNTEELDLSRIPQHVAIIMDGNGRWAKLRGQERSYGHQAGAETVHIIAEEASKLGIKYLTLYTFSTENWKRPQSEIDAIMDLLRDYLDELERLNAPLPPVQQQGTERQWLNIALPKGRLGDKAYGLLAAAGYEANENYNETRKLVVENPEAGVRYFLVKPSDVAIYVEHGAADIGIVGKDILTESGADVYELLDTGMGKCRMCVAGPRNFVDDESRALRVATKFVNIARAHYESIGRDIDIIKLNGSIELAPILGLSDVIVDIVETGTTLRENGLQVVTEFMPISARFIANKASYQFKHNEMDAMLEALRKTLQEETK